ncbi:MAG: hypothetical protein JSR98_21630 [Proteobacteria bacterium]|nr:hypothetical protein [Pseudomonadota bacterium]
MLDCWLRVRNERGSWEDRASFLADNDAQAMRLARQLVPTGEIKVRRGEREIA